MSRTAISAVALVCAAVVAGDATTAQVAAAPTRGDTGDLRASLLRGSPAAGQRYAHVQLTNISPRSCTIFGYAGAQLLRADGSRVPTDIVRDHAGTDQVHPGQRDLRHASERAAGAASCLALCDQVPDPLTAPTGSWPETGSS
jgi:hypothetical protein